MGPKWKLGALIQQYFDLGGNDANAEVKLTNIQYLYYYSLSETMSIGAGPNIIINWEQPNDDDKVTLPIGMGINKTIKIGKVPVRLGFETHYSVIKPGNVPGTEWDFRFYVIPAVPSALFKWMK
jgi:hypothetical protein